MIKPPLCSSHTGCGTQVLHAQLGRRGRGADRHRRHLCLASLISAAAMALRSRWPAVNGSLQVHASGWPCFGPGLSRRPAAQLAVQLVKRPFGCRDPLRITRRPREGEAARHAVLCRPVIAALVGQHPKPA